MMDWIVLRYEALPHSTAAERLKHGWQMLECGHEHNGVCDIPLRYWRGRHKPSTSIFASAIGERDLSFKVKATNYTTVAISLGAFL